MQFHESRSRFVSCIACAALLAVFPKPPALAEEPLPSADRLRTSPVLQHLKPNPMPSPPRTPAEETVAQMYLPEGFRAELILAEPDVRQPVAFAFDERGRIWVAEAHSYPAKRPVGEGLDRLVIFDDGDGDGRFETRKVFAEGLNLVSGFEVGYGGVWVGAAPELLFISDRNRDDAPDGPPEPLLDGFGFQDTHECLNSFLWGPDGWLYGNQGVFNTSRIGKPGSPDAHRVELRAGVWRYHPARREFEVFAHGGSNQWGLDFDERGQLFMTHCRSYWGRGLTTHVIQGGHYWNQANANHAPFIIGNPPEGHPGFRNYLLASARYDHGAGGAGKPGSDIVYGGHSHVGTMVYLGDNWPDEVRGHLFTHNLGGHQINHQINRRLGSGFDTVHAGEDQFFCTDPKYVAVDLQYGPDGAVYVIDWYDRQHCHNPNTERWERASGRVYRIEYAATYKPKKVDLSALDDAALVDLHAHKSEWFVRTARRLLHERSLARPIDPKAKAALVEMARSDREPSRRLRALWTLHAARGFSDEGAGRALRDSDEYVRGWTVQLLAEDRDVPPALLEEFVRLAGADPSPVVRLFLASAVQRVPEEAAWRLIEALARHSEDADDRNLPFLLWYRLAERMPGRLDRAFGVLERSGIPQLADFVHWYAATSDAQGLDRAIERLEGAEGEALGRRLAGIEMAIASRAHVATPAAWIRIAPKLNSGSSAALARRIERLAAAFGDDSMFPRLRAELADPGRDAASRKHAFAILSRASDAGSLPIFLRLLDDDAFRSQAIRLIGRFDAAEVPEALISRFETLSPENRSAALNALTGRATFARALLDAVAAGKLKRERLTSFHVRQLAELRDAEVDRRVRSTWGTIVPTPAEKQAQMARLEKTFQEAPLWAFDGRAGRRHFEKICMQCHRLGDGGANIGPDLTGAGKHGIRYFLENTIDPNAVVGTDYRLTTIATRKGEFISGLIVRETPATLAIHTVAGEVVAEKADILRRETSESSLMPEGLLGSLNDREQIELLKFLTSL